VREQTWLGMRPLASLGTGPASDYYCFCGLLNWSVFFVSLSNAHVVCMFLFSRPPKQIFGTSVAKPSAFDFSWSSQIVWGLPVVSLEKIWDDRTDVFNDARQQHQKHSTALTCLYARQWNTCTTSHCFFCYITDL